MRRKPMTVTSRHLEEHPPIAERRIRSPLPNPPPNRQPIARLSFDGPTIKFDCSAADLVQIVGVSAMADAVLFLDTNIFTRELDQSVWDAFSEKQIFITGGVWKELLPWLKTPFCNVPARDRVLAAIRTQVNSKTSSADSVDRKENAALDSPKIELLFDDENFLDHGYWYYHNLLALRKAWGPIADEVLAKQLGENLQRMNC
jgi:hypothetical protein